MKVFIGTHENCGIINGLEEGFKELGHSVYSLVKNKSRFSSAHEYCFEVSNEDNDSITDILSKIDFPLVIKGYKYLKRKKSEIELKNVFKSLYDFDLYIYTWDTVLPNLEDLKILKRLGKKVFFLFIGSDARFASAFMQQYPDVHIPWDNYYINEDINRKITFVRTIEKYADVIFSVPDQSGLLVRPYMHVYLPLKVSSIPFKYPDNEVPIVIHAPSKRSFKGTNRILSSVEQLKSEGLQFDFRLLENLPNEQVKNELKEADIVVDQIFLSGVGMLGTEALAYGCALASKNKAELGLKFNPPSWYIDDSENLTEDLRNLILNRAKRKEIAIEGRKYVEKYNEPVAIAKLLEEIYNKDVIDYDYIPQFFVESFKCDNSVGEVSNNVKKMNKENIERFYPFKYDLNSLRKRNLIL